MGEANLNYRVNDQIIDEDWYNELNNALEGNIVPRNTSGVVTNEAGSVGTDTYKWLDGRFQNVYGYTKLQVGLPAWNNIINSTSTNLNIKRNNLDILDASNSELRLKRDNVAVLYANVTNTDIYVAGILKGRFTSTGMSGTYLTDDTTPKRKMVPLGQQTSAQSSFSTNSASFVDATGFSISITTTGRPVFITLKHAEGELDPASINVSTVSDNSATGFVRIMRDSTQVALYQIRTSSDGLDNAASISLPSSVVNTLDIVGAGTYVYKIQLKVFSTVYSCSIIESKLYAFEL